MKVMLRIPRIETALEHAIQSAAHHALFVHDYDTALALAMTLEGVRSKRECSPNRFEERFQSQAGQEPSQ